MSKSLPQRHNVQPPKLLARVRTACRLRHYSYRTEQSYVAWVRRFCYYHRDADGWPRHPDGMSEPEVIVRTGKATAGRCCRQPLPCSLGRKPAPRQDSQPPERGIGPVTHRSQRLAAGLRGPDARHRNRLSSAAR